MKAKELREMTDVELNKQLKDLKAELFNQMCIRDRSCSLFLCMAIVSSPSLQLQTGLAGTLSESLHTAVVNEEMCIRDRTTPLA